MRGDFSLVDLVAATVVVSVSGGVLAVALSAKGQSLEIDARARGEGRLKGEETNAANIAKALAVYAQSNKDWYPGITSAGKYAAGDFKGKTYAASAIANGAEEERTGAGCTIAAGQAMAQALLMEEALTAPAQWISPGERDAEVEAAAARPEGQAKVEARHDSYALLAYGKQGLKPEWKCNMNQQAVCLASRMIFGEKRGQHSSLWTDENSGRWRGVVVRGDGSEEIQNTPAGADALGVLKYGAVVFTPVGNSAAVTGLFGRHTDMANFNAAARSAQLGSAMDGVKDEKKEVK